MTKARWLFLVCVALAPLQAQQEPIKISAWYWLNSAPKSEWERDFQAMRDLGFTHAVLCWGLDLAAVAHRQGDTRQALGFCRRAGLKAYLVIWHPTHNSLERRPEFQQKDIAGRLRFSFDVFNPKWRASQWKSYLQTVAKAYRDEPAFAGYVFDDSFGMGPIERFAGESGPAEQRVLPGGDQRATSWEDWARETVQFIREADPDRSHEIYLEDEEYVLGPRARESYGVDFGRVAKHFDAVGAYTARPWDSPGAGKRLAEHTRSVLERTRAVVGDKKIIYTFWVANSTELRKPGPAQFPTAEQIRQIADTALQFGIRHLDLYGFRIGDWAVTGEQWPKARPGTEKDYPLTGSFPGKFLYDRTSLHQELRAYLRGLTEPSPQAFEVLCAGPHHDPCEKTLEWKTPQEIGQVVVNYASLFGRVYQPVVSGQSLEHWDGARWRTVRPRIEIDYSRQNELALLQGAGTVRWTYRFPPVETTRMRLLLAQPENPDPGHRVYAIRSVEVSAGPGTAVEPGIRVAGQRATMPSWLEPGANLAAAAHVSKDNPVEVRWSRRVLVNHVNVAPAMASLRVEWWDGNGWRSTEALPPARTGEARFLPVATERLRIGGNAAPVRRVEARLDSEANRYFYEIENSRIDLLGGRFETLPRPDLAAMQGILLPLDFAKVAIGRPADLQETIVMWNGTFLMAEPDHWDRWFASAAGPQKELFGTDWMRTATRYADGYLPATITTYDHGGFDFEQRMYVTAPDEPLYGTVAEVKVTNRSLTARQTAFTLAVGRRRNQRGPGSKSSPFYFDPVVTGYALDGDKHTVRSAKGEIILYSESEGAWEGTTRENHLRYPLSLGPGESQVLRFFAPSVEKPLGDAAPLRRFDWQGSLARFRAWWNRKLDAGAKIEVPERALNDIYRNLLAQSLIITLDGDSQVKYGAYFYESYFGIEEGWPAVALAQYGHPAEAQKILSIMLSPELMDKKNYHHQYRNGLEPWYAATIFRLTRDRAWLEKIAPDLEAAAEWTIRVTGENKDPRYGGLLPRHAYGGDIKTPAYSFYSNATCWRGLHDTALLFRMLGREEQARRYQQEADRYRRRLWELAEQLADRKENPPFLPMSFEVGSGAEYREKEPSYPFLGINVPASNTWTYLANYWNLFAPMLLEVKLFEKQDARAAWVPDYMDARGGILAGLARFTVGLDQIYGKGYYESLLERGLREKFLTSLYGIFAHGMSQNLYSFPEVAGVFPARVNNAAMWREHERNLWNWYFLWNWGFEGWQTCEGEPLSAGPGMALQMLRMALLRETVESSPQDTLRLLDGAPAHWFEPGKRIVVRDAPTFFGRVSVETEALENQVRAQVERSPHFEARQVILRLAHPAGRPLRAVTIGGRPWRDFSGEEIRLPQGDRLEVIATFQ